MTESAKFKGFLSYSRKDEDAVRRLHRRLESYEIPKPLRRGGPARLGRFFRDKDELAAASELGAELNVKLAATEWLIVCCSPNSAASHWVGAEVDAFIATHGHERVLAVVLDGDPHDVFPPSLRQREPLAADFRKQGDGEELGFLKLVAGLIGADLGEVRDRHAAAERARTRNRAILAGVFGVLAIAAATGAVIAVQQRDRAEAMTAEAIGIGAGVLGETDNLSQRFGVPTSALQELVSFADQRFARLFARDVHSQELARQRATVLVQFAELYQRTGDSARSRAEALAAIAMFERFPPDALYTVDYVRALSAAGAAEAALGRDAEAVAYLQRAIVECRAMLADIPDARLGRIGLASALQRLGELHMHAGRPREALPLFVEAVSLAQYVRDRQPDNAVTTTSLITVLDWLGGAQALAGDRAAAQATFARSIGMAREWLERDPENLAARSNLGNSLMKQGEVAAEAEQYALALAPLEESLGIARALVASDPNDAEFQHALGVRLVLTANVLTALGQSPGAMIDEAIATTRVRVGNNPTNMYAKDTLAIMLGVRAAHEPDAAARDSWREVVELRRAIRAAAPADAPAPAADLADALVMVGDTSAGLRDVDAMLAAYAEAISLRRTVLAAAPQNREVSLGLASVLYALGETKLLTGDNAGAQAPLAEAAAIRVTLAEASPDDADIAFTAVGSLQQLGLAQSTTDGAAALQSFRNARDILRRLVAAHPDDARYAESLARTEAVLAP